MWNNYSLSWIWRQIFFFYIKLHCRDCLHYFFVQVDRREPALYPHIRGTTGTLYEVIIHVLILARTNIRFCVGGGGGLTQNVSLPPPPTSLLRARRKERKRKKKRDVHEQPIKSRTRLTAIAGINILLQDYWCGVSHTDNPCQTTTGIRRKSRVTYVDSYRIGSLRFSDISIE